MHRFRQLLLPDFHICIIKFCRDCYKLRTVSCQRDTSQVISKVLERLVYDSISTYSKVYISDRQFGFLRNRSTVPQLLILLNSIINTKNQTDTIYIDIRKAFDTVPHNELLIKLRTMGISGNLWQWFKSYLLNRQHCVKIQNKYSDLLPVVSGIPQGSILGPLYCSLCMLMISPSTLLQLRYFLQITLSVLELLMIQLILLHYNKILIL